MAKTSKKKGNGASAKRGALQRIALPALAKGEVYAGIILEKGKPVHHVVLLAGQANDVTLAGAKAFAKKAGGELPTRREQSLLFANCGGEFESRWYWSGEQRAGDAGYSWMQYFGDGDQDWGDVGLLFLARAVRRVAIR